jgi:methyl-accepting chemotaxis protein
MSLKRKLLFLVILPVVLSTAIAISISSVSIYQQGIRDIENNSNSILDIYIRHFLRYHEDGSMTDDGLISADNNHDGQYNFRLASPDPLNDIFLATDQEMEFIKTFEENHLSELKYTDEENNNLWIMRPVYFDSSQNCHFCHKTDDNLLGNHDTSNDIRGLFIITTNMQEVNDQVQSSIVKISGIGLLLVFIVIILGTIIIGKINTIFGKIIFASKKISQGDLNVEVDIKSKDELGTISETLQIMIKALREIVGSIVSGADYIASASQHISTNSQQVAQGASEQASSVEEISSSMEQMLANIEQNTQNSQHTEKISSNAAQFMIKLGASTTKSLDSIRSISEKISIINDIAFQTNILALNASVEAARAGDHGKGFAVVAAEVRKLAERSKIAADEIVELSRSSVQVTEEAAQFLEQALPEIQKTATLIKEITAASLEQNIGAEQIKNALNQLNSVTQLNAAAAEEMATSSEELTSQADQLDDLVSFFKTDAKSNLQLA